MTDLEFVSEGFHAPMNLTHTVLSVDDVLLPGYGPGPLVSFCEHQKSSTRRRFSFPGSFLPTTGVGDFLVRSTRSFF